MTNVTAPAHHQHERDKRRDRHWQSNNARVAGAIQRPTRERPHLADRDVRERPCILHIATLHTAHCILYPAHCMLRLATAYPACSISSVFRSKHLQCIRRTPNATKVSETTTQRSNTQMMISSPYACRLVLGLVLVLVLARADLRVARGGTCSYRSCPGQIAPQCLMPLTYSVTRPALASIAPMIASSLQTKLRRHPDQQSHNQ